MECFKNVTNTNDAIAYSLQLRNKQVSTCRFL